MREDVPKAIKVFLELYLAMAALTVVVTVLRIGMQPYLPSNVSVAAVTLSVAIASLASFLAYLVRSKRSIGAKWAVVALFFLNFLALPFSIMVSFDVWEVLLTLLHALAVYQLFLPGSEDWFSGGKP